MRAGSLFQNLLSHSTFPNGKMLSAESERTLKCSPTFSLIIGFQRVRGALHTHRASIVTMGKAIEQTGEGKTPVGWGEVLPLAVEIGKMHVNNAIPQTLIGFYRVQPPGAKMRRIQGQVAEVHELLGVVKPAGIERETQQSAGWHVFHRDDYTGGRFHLLQTAVTQKIVIRFHAGPRKGQKKAAAAEKVKLSCYGAETEWQVSNHHGNIQFLSQCNCALKPPQLVARPPIDIVYKRAMKDCDG